MNEPVAEVEHQDISESEWILLETLDCRQNRPLHTGPFLTVQRRRRRRKYVRTYLFKDPTLIDDLSTYQTNFVLDRINNWAFNAFILDNVTGGGFQLFKLAFFQMKTCNNHQLHNFLVTIAHKGKLVFKKVLNVNPRKMTNFSLSRITRNKLSFL